MNTESQKPSTQPELNEAVEPDKSQAIPEPEATGDAALEGDSTETKPEKTAEQKELEYLRRKATKADRVQGKLYQELQAERQARTAYEARVSQGEQPNQQATQQQADPYELAREIAALDKVTQQSNDVAKEGNKRFSDFGAALSVVIEEAGPLIHNEGRGKGLPTPLGEAILEAGDPAALLHFLGSNPALADELSGLSPTQLGRRIERFEAQMKAKPVKPVSNAPAPIKPLQGSNTNASVKTLEAMSPSEYKAFRSKQGAAWAR